MKIICFTSSSINRLKKSSGVFPNMFTVIPGEAVNECTTCIIILTVAYSLICLLVGNEHDVFDENVVDDKTGSKKEVVGSNANEVVGAEDVIGGSAK